ncbi:hypothetical protein [Actinoplanes teichomyceticus]|uniref:Uncharacterized protein n=1 Tax=Actinoplanes teichomyceticus TaxID=1867 RepID=A0A561VS85_ACTTI|nr:hypothetical protein [Actinoplanes teichomyceticus]TWG14489.1 hypothetical protein FHX34_104789 [Actinoplanes teichomyceticus]GIF16294.1 hypothetical protein Ate01nite_63260 [Actinoplanes teichomyceticus]
MTTEPVPLDEALADVHEGVVAVGAWLTGQARGQEPAGTRSRHICRRGCPAEPGRQVAGIAIYDGGLRAARRAELSDIASGDDESVAKGIRS